MPAVDATHLWRGLYQGSRPPVGPWVKAAGFDVLVLAAEEYQPPDRMFPGVLVLHVPLDDAEMDSPSRKAIRSASRLVEAYVKNGHRVLVTCAMGLNRSGIISAAALRRATCADPVEIVHHIRARRGARALSNPSFVSSLRRGELGGSRCPSR